jgi:hypothetical protein
MRLGCYIHVHVGETAALNDVYVNSQ